MELKQLHQEVDQKLANLDAEIERFQSNIQTSDDAEQRELLEQDLATLQRIREKLIKAKSITQEVTDLRTSVENPKRIPAKIGGVPVWLIIGGVVIAFAASFWWGLAN